MSTIATSSNTTLIADTAAQAAEQGNAVVLHDIAAVSADTSAKAITNVREAITKLVADKQAWEANAYRTSNEQLYALLARCYGIYVLMTANRSTASQLRADVDKYLADTGSKVSDSAHTLTKIVKAVFGADRRRVSAYSIALRKALADKINAADIPEYIRDSGGVEELRLARSPNAKTPMQKALAAAQTIEQTVLAKLRLETLLEKLDAAKIGTQHVLIVTQGADGAFDVNALVSASSAVNAALAAHYSQIKAEADKAQVQEKQARDDNARAQLIAEAAQSVLQ